jgi:iron complex outermembrane receptor protein
MPSTQQTLLALGAASLLFVASTSQAQTPDPVADRNDELTEVIVTASRREEKLRDVPAAITTIGADIISNAGVQDFRDYASLVPGMS